ncbi:DUF4845 domain-containing protein [Thiogranum longum]|jgi:Tfp pilus assembly major pilin PilA
MKTWHRQKGMTAIGWMLVLGLIAFFALVTLRLLPLYLEYAKVASTFESLANEAGIATKTRPEILSLIGKRFEVNDVRSVDPKLTQVRKEGRAMKVSIQYERREHLVGNIDVVAVFEKSVEVSGN